jgi:hypothetical protein
MVVRDLERRKKEEKIYTQAPHREASRAAEKTHRSP